MRRTCWKLSLAKEFTLHEMKLKKWGPGFKLTSLDKIIRIIGNQRGTRLTYECHHIWNIIGQRVQVAGVIDIQNMSSGWVPEITVEIILLNFSDNSITFPIFVFIRLINSTIYSFWHSLHMSRPKTTSDKYVETHWVDSKKTIFLLYRFRSVLDVT